MIIKQIKLHQTNYFCLWSGPDEPNYLVWFGYFVGLVPVCYVVNKLNKKDISPILLGNKRNNFNLLIFCVINFS